MKQVFQNKTDEEYIEVIERLLDLCSEREGQIKVLESRLAIAEARLISENRGKSRKKPAPPRQKKQECSDPSKSIIIAEDCQVMQHMLKGLLASHGIGILGVAENGRDAVQLFRKHSPALTLMDIAMPVMDGIEATRQIIQHDSNAKIIVITGDGEKETVVKALQAGASEYLTKPIEARNLLRVIDYYLHYPHTALQNRSTEFVI
jgi:two-component system chemotaxis response regulator CheY